MIRALVLVALVACKSDKKPPEPSPRPVEAPAKKDALVIEPAAKQLSGTLWFVDETNGHRLMRLEAGVAKQVGKGAGVFGSLYPTTQRLPDGRVVAIASHGDGRPDGEQLVLITSTGSIATFGPAATQVRDPAVSPDGTWIAVAVQREGITNLDVVSVTSGEAKQLTTNKEGNFAPVAISKDAIAFVSSRDGDSEIYRVNVDGTKEQRLTAFHREDYEPAIDSTGGRLAFTSDREQKVPRIFVVRPDGTGVARLTTRSEPHEESTVVWAAKGDGYAYTLKRDGHMVVASVVGGVEKVITPPKTNEAEVAFSPDGKWLVVVRDEHELVAYPLPAGSGAPIVVARGHVRSPRWF